MRLDTVQIGSAQPSPAGQLDTTGIDKEPVSQARVTAAGLIDDVVVDTKNHGGPDQAVYIYFRDDYDFWETELDRELPGGAFGENLTISGMNSGDVKVGDMFDFGGVLLEATAGRIPCAVFAEKLGMSGWVERFRQGRRPGVYCRVLSEGTIRPGQEVNHIECARCSGDVTVLEVFEMYYDRSASAADLERVLAAPVAIRAREDYARRLARLENKSES